MQQRWHQIGSLIRKEFIAIWREKRIRIVLILPPIIQLLVFSYAVTYEVRNVRVGIYTEDFGPVVHSLIARFQGAQRTIASVQLYASYRQLQQALLEQRILAGIRIQKDFSRKILAGMPETVQLLLDGRRANAAMILQGYVAKIVSRVARQFAPAQVQRSLHFPSLVTRVWFNPNLLSTWSALPALVVILSNLVVLMITALTIARERELGTFEQLLVSPLTSYEVLIGKAIPPFVLGFVEGSLMMVLITVLFGLPLTFQSAVLLLLTLVPFLFSIVGVGLFVSSLASTQQQGLLGAFTYQVPAVLLSGFATPLDNIHPAIRWIADINPLQYAITATRVLFLEHPSAAFLVHLVAPLVPISIGTLTAAALLFRSKVG